MFFCRGVGCCDASCKTYIVIHNAIAGKYVSDDCLPRQNNMPPPPSVPRLIVATDGPMAKAAPKGVTQCQLHGLD